MNYHIPLQTNTFYHIFSRATGEEQLFRNEENYKYFLNKFKIYINPIADTYGYCLLPNHFHLLIKIKDDSDIDNRGFNRTKQKPISEYLMQSFF